MRRLTLLAAMSLATLSCYGGTASDEKPAKIIYDTDMCTDCDDAGALALLNRLADLGEAEILAVVVNGTDRDNASASVADAINTWYGRPNVPLAAGRNCPARDPSRYTTKIKADFPNNAEADDKLPDAVSAYRRVLAAQPDQSVTVVTVGFMNNIKDILESKADEHSPLGGVELVRRKARRLVSMAGEFPRGRGYFNFDKDIPSAQFAVAHWPGPIVFATAPIGNEVLTGPALQTSPKSNPVRRVFELYGVLQSGRPSWDQTTVLFAVRGTRDYWHISDPGRVDVSVATDPQGRPISITTWTPDPNGRHQYLSRKMDFGKLSRHIDEMMAQPPRAAGDQEKAK